ncbi:MULTISPECIES: MFS transporter [Bacillus]|uniref:MFS transporter n=2 Tax=Bacillus TaxID=1386 RepID=A0A0M4FXG1_9BACI|nr:MULTISPECIES: MFS transporter [Bacillus]ALC83643.1 MFS transporter [Bacillus gobiensis]MBP1082661.1 MFS family permease [Bacillus capparidis]MED1097112.1 MFS transporter [Bacillus capparidis]
MKHNGLKWLVLSQSGIFFASSLIFPFYILFLKNVGSSYTQFGFSYGLFGMSAALIHPVLGKLSNRVDSRYFLSGHAWGMAILLLFYPHIESIGQVYTIQILLGLFGSMQKHGEKILLADVTDGAPRGTKIGNYHFWTSIFSAAAIILGGFLADYFTIHFIFYASSVLFFVSGCLSLGIEKNTTD